MKRTQTTSPLAQYSQNTMANYLFNVNENTKKTNKRNGTTIPPCPSVITVPLLEDVTRLTDRGGISVY